jgi:hypothetical protein
MGASGICEGETTILTPTISGGTWSASNSNATVSGGSVTGSAAGSVTISYGVSNICGTAYTVHPLTVNPLPDAGTITSPGTVCVGDAITLGSTATGGTWISKFGNTSISGSVVTGLTAGTDDLLYIVTNSCGSDTATTAIVVNTCITATSNTGTRPAPQILPNPASDKLFINTNGARYSMYTIINNLGQVVAEHVLDGGQTTVIISSLTPGIYHIRLTGEDGAAVLKFVHVE